MGAYAPSLHTTQAPDIRPRPYGLFSVARPVDDSSSHWRNGEKWEPDPCGTAGGIGPDCDPESAIGLPKTFKRQDELTETTAFVVYGSYLCSPIGRDPAEATERARRDLELHEERAVEEFLWTGELGNAPSLTDSATNLTATAVDPATAIGLLEQFLAERYGGIGVIHVPRLAVATLKAHQLIYADGPQLVTCLDTPVAAHSADTNTAPNGDAAGEDTAWAYITPALRITRSPVFSDEHDLKLLDRKTNDLYAVAERYYSVGWDDCGHAAANLNLGS